MPQVVFDQATKSYGDTEVLQPFSTTVDDGEFLVLLGPSGCGKSTLLRMIAGLTGVTSGAIRFDEEQVNDWDVRRRNVAFVFQSYALYPQMTVRGNIAFPLLMDRMARWHHLPIVGSVIRRRLARSAAVAQKVERIAEQMGLSDLLERRPAALSGGQRQRVALARSLVRDPSIYLLDEPLSNLDAKLRTQMRVDITTLHRTVGKTFIYVTHDQIEAMTMATRIVVMDHGRIQQIGTPDEIYDRPSNTFVATFVGSPAMNLIASDVVRSHISALPGQAATVIPDGSILGVRPENVLLSTSPDEGVPSRVEVVERVGAETLVGCRLDLGEGSGERVFARVQGSHAARPGDACGLTFEPSAISWFSQDSGERIDRSAAAVAA